MAEGEKEVVIQVVPGKLNESITINYKNKDDLFKQYKKWIKSLNLPSNEVYWCDQGGDHTGIRNSDDILRAVHNFGYAKLFTPYADECEYDWNFCSDENDENKDNNRGRSREKKRTTNSRSQDSTASVSSSPPPGWDLDFEKQDSNMNKSF